MSRSRPFFPSALLVALPLLCANALAQPADEAIKAARKRFDEGTAAYDAGRYEAARIAFHQAYAIKPHPAVLRNLGEAELKTGHYVEAAQHFASFLDSSDGNGATERVRESLARAEQQVARLSIQVSVPSADVYIDGEVVGHSSLAPEPRYIEPGNHVV